MNAMWGDKRYYSLNCFLRQKFGEKVFKISLDAGFSCPNRDGTLSSDGCIFCSSRGSGEFAGNRELSISKQFDDIKELMSKKWKCRKYIAYFQAYTNTYASVDILRKLYWEALDKKGVVGLAIATRPDCLSEDILDLLEELNKRVYVWIELGLQTSNDDTAKIINRGYDIKTFEKAVSSLRKRNIDVVVHTIFGLPGEDRGDMINTIKYLSSKDIQGIKFHLLYLVEGAPLVELYEKGEFNFMGKEEYTDLVCDAITLLPRDIIIHRLTGDAPRDILIGPLWSLKKWEVLNLIDKKMKERNLVQGLYFS